MRLGAADGRARVPQVGNPMAHTHPFLRARLHSYLCETRHATRLY